VCKVKCTLVKALRLCTGHTAHRGSRGIALLFHDHGTRRGWGVSVTPQPLFTLRKDPVPILQEAGWAPRPVWTGAENLTPTGIQSPDHPARGQLLYRQSYLYCVWGSKIDSILIRCQTSYLVSRSWRSFEGSGLGSSDNSLFTGNFKWHITIFSWSPQFCVYTCYSVIIVVIIPKFFP
jgi:hypothetical protein